MNKALKYHYFLLSYAGSVGDGSTIVSQRNKYVSKSLIEDGKANFTIGEDAFLKNVSYLGEMTEEEFNDE